MLQNKLSFHQSSVSLEIIGLPDYSNNENKDQISIIWNDFNKRFIELINERFNTNSMRVKKLLHQTGNDEILIKSLLTLSLCISNEGCQKLKNFLFNF